MKYGCTLLAVDDVDVSKKFYGELFEQTVVVNFFWKNVSFTRVRS